MSDVEDSLRASWKAESTGLGLVWGMVMNKTRLRLEGTQHLTDISSASVKNVPGFWKVIRREHTESDLPSRKESINGLAFYQIMELNLRKSCDLPAITRNSEVKDFKKHTYRKADYNFSSPSLFACSF